ncbi:MULTISPECIES: UV damage repair protein UvrX [unclassified Sporosarcina]|uniref:Y-family DNA polymerase n=1 Tax=unclassified Sporosarcina TaxID=2647733 RepID=UPI00203B52CA|nr:MULTISPECIES: UV damage repair protein UvrX [unclassified Sporosarcina]GKV64524.1 putative UV-damage repair protein UvrX [Sporosarcina sp. NCCP-2331]GLB54603.1 putative UV-damage repair protein UvrX [Sporosarcina sp. NCCP-2378]
MEQLPNKQIACLDMRSFYASCAAAIEGLDVMETPIAIIGNIERKGGVVLAASPPLKKQFGIKTGMRLYEIPNDPSIQLIEPKMQFYIDVSMELTKLLNRYVPKEAIHVYSIDESFVDFTGTEKLWGPLENLIDRIQDELYRQFQLRSACGVGPNMLLSKLALDLEAKKTGVAYWTYEDVPEKLWPIAPLRNMWGIGRRLERTLEDMGVYSVGDLAHTPLDHLEKKFGVMGNQLYYHAHGIDYSELGSVLIEGQISYGKGQTLLRDYITMDEILTVVLEMCEDTAMRTRLAGKKGRTVQLSFGYSKHALGGGFNRRKTLTEATDQTMIVYRTCMELIEIHHDGRPVRHISVSLANLEESYGLQLSLFEPSNWKQQQIGRVMDELRMKYGSASILRAVSVTSGGTAYRRNQLIGGHYK